jgi:hypothetical protein
MTNFEKPLHEFTEEELQQKINQWDPRYGTLAVQELQRRQQEKNTEQISVLIKEIKKLKDITKENTEISYKNTHSASKIAKWAFIMATVSTLVVVMEFKTHIGWPEHCDYLYDFQGHPSHKKCLYVVEFGDHNYFWEDKEYISLKPGERGQ